MDIIKKIGTSGVIVLLLLFLFVPVTRITVIIIVLIVLISVAIRNPISIYLFYCAMGSFLSFLVAVARVGTIFYKSAELANNLILALTLVNIFDLFIYIETSTWTTIGHLFGFIIFGGLGLLVLILTND